MNQVTGWIATMALLLSSAAIADQHKDAQTQADKTKSGADNGEASHERGEVVGSIEPEYPTTEEAKYEEEVEGASAGKVASDGAGRSNRSGSPDASHQRGEVVGSIEPEYPTTEEAKYEEEVEGASAGKVASDGAGRSDRSGSPDGSHQRGEVVGSIEPEYPTTEEAKYEEEVASRQRSKNDKGASAADRDGMRVAMRASKIIGMDVEGPGGKTVGQVHDLVIPAGDDDIKAVISVGGFLGIGDKLVAVSYDDLSASNAGRGRLYLDETKDSLEAMSAFEYERRAKASGKSGKSASAREGEKR